MSVPALDTIFFLVHYHMTRICLRQKLPQIEPLYLAFHTFPTVTNGKPSKNVLKDNKPFFLSVDSVGLGHSHINVKIHRTMFPACIKEAFSKAGPCLPAVSKATLPHLLVLGVRR